jgi:hypothetical protein
MTDVLERLRADNPVADGSPPTFEEVWDRIERERRPSGPRRGSSRRARMLLLTSMATVPVVLVALFALVTLGNKRPSANSGGLRPGATILHYRVQTVFHPSPGAGFGYELTTSDVWVSGSLIHRIVSSRWFSTAGRLQETVLRETTTDGHRAERFSVNPARPKGELTISPAPTGGTPCGQFFHPVALRLGEFCGAAFRDPAGALRQLYERRELSVVVRNTGLPGHRLDELLLRHPGWVVEIFVKHRTFIPVEVIAHPIGSSSWGESVIATITDYRRLPLTASNRGLLQMRLHPGARVTCVGPGGAVQRVVTYPHEKCSAVVKRLERLDALARRIQAAEVLELEHGLRQLRLGLHPSSAVRIIAQVNLNSPSHGRKAVGMAEIVRADHRYGVLIMAQGVAPNAPGTSYAAWLTGTRRPLLLGFIPHGVGAIGRLTTAGRLPADARSYRFLLITLEHTHTPRHPGEVVLRGRLPLS